jgi:hypothetical protein
MHEKEIEKLQVPASRDVRKKGSCKMNQATV